MSKENISLIIQHQNTPPKYFEINKYAYKLLIYVFPLLSLFTLIIIIWGSLYWSSVNSYLKTKKPIEITKLNQEKQLLHNEIRELKSLSILLQNKLGKIEVPTINTLGLFRTIPGMIDKTIPPTFMIDNAVTEYNKTQLKFSFNLVKINHIINKSAGFIFVICKTSSGILFYPHNSLLEKDLFINFSRGESFATTKFRPVKAIFNNIKQQSSYLFRILVFSRDGNIIHQQVIEK